MDHNHERHPHLLQDPTRILEFIQAGKAIFTVKNRKTGGRATYRVEKQVDESTGKARFAVAAFTGSDNAKKGSYTLMGVMSEGGAWVPRTFLTPLAELEAAILKDGGGWKMGFVQSIRKRQANGRELTSRQEYRLGVEMRRYKVQGYVTDKVQLAAFPWLWGRLISGKEIPEQVEIWHEGHCARCSRRLTVPASVELGFGPDCAGQIGKAEQWNELNRKLGEDLEAYAARLAEARAAAA